MSKANEPAFPQPKPTLDGCGYHFDIVVGGLTKREYFAGLAMQGILASASGVNEPEHWVKLSIKYADTLIKELSMHKETSENVVLK